MLINVSIERIVKMRYSSSAYIDAMRYDERKFSCGPKWLAGTKGPKRITEMLEDVSQKQMRIRGEDKICCCKCLIVSAAANVVYLVKQ